MYKYKLDYNYRHLHKRKESLYESKNPYRINNKELLSEDRVIEINEDGSPKEGNNIYETILENPQSSKVTKNEDLKALKIEKPAIKENSQPKEMSNETCEPVVECITEDTVVNKNESSKKSGSLTKYDSANQRFIEDYRIADQKEKRCEKGNDSDVIKTSESHEKVNQQERDVYEKIDRPGNKSEKVDQEQEEGDVIEIVDVIKSSVESDDVVRKGS